MKDLAKCRAAKKQHFLKEERFESSNGVFVRFFVCNGYYFYKRYDKGGEKFMCYEVVYGNDNDTYPRTEAFSDRAWCFSTMYGLRSSFPNMTIPD